MPKCDLQHASAQINWRFTHIPPSLPVPGTEAFASLTDGLKQYGVTPQGISLDTPTSNLGDVALDIALPESRVRVRITYSGYEVMANAIEEDEEEKILGIVAVVCEVLRKIDKRADEGNGTTRISLHLQLLDSSIEDYLATFATARSKNPPMVADAVAFKLASDEATNSFETRVVLAKSIPHDNALYLEINCEIKPTEAGDFIEILRNIDGQHWESVMSIFELVPVDAEV